MGTFNYKSFADLSQVFDCKKGHLVPRTPKVHVILFAPRNTAYQIPVSKFTSVQSYIPTIRPRFISVAGKPLSLKAELAASATSAQAHVQPVEEIKARPILKLKT